MTGGPGLADFEADLRRRLADVAADTTLDDHAWEKIETRATTGRLQGVRARSRTSRARVRRQLAALAAVVVLVVGLVVLSRHDDDSRTDTVDTTTTTGEGATSSTTERGRTTTTSVGELPERPGSGTGPESDGPGGSGGSGSGGGAGTDPDGSAPDTGTGSSGGAAGGSTPSSTPPAGPATPPDGHPVVASIGRSGYTVDVTAYESGGSYYMNLWRDRTQYVAEWNWGKQPGQNCLAGQGGEYGSGDLAGLRFGFVRSDAASVRVVTTSGNTSTAVLGAEFVPGLRAWIGQRPPGQVDRFEALDAGGNVLHTAAAPVWDASPDTC